MEIINQVSADTVINGIATLVSVFIGAMLAFVTQYCIQYKQDRNVALLSAHRIMFCLFQQIDKIVRIQRDFIWPHINSTVKYIEIPAVQDFDIEKDTFNLDTFSFMLKNSKSRKVMYDLYLAQDSYVEALRAFNARSRLHRDEVQPRLANLKIANGKPVLIGEIEIEQVLGKFVLLSVQNTTDQSILSLKHAFTKLIDSKVAFRAFAVKEFKTNDFTDFDMPDDFGLSVTDNRCVSKQT